MEDGFTPANWIGAAMPHQLISKVSLLTSRLSIKWNFDRSLSEKSGACSAWKTFRALLPAPTKNVAAERMIFMQSQ